MRPQGLIPVVWGLPMAFKIQASSPLLFFSSVTFFTHLIES